MEKFIKRGNKHFKQVETEVNKPALRRDLKQAQADKKRATETIKEINNILDNIKQ